MNNDVLEILLSILAAVLSGGVGILTIYLKKRWSAADLEKALKIIEESVRYVEIVGAAAGWNPQEKKDHALEWLSGKLNMPEAEVEGYLEAAVARLKAAGEELTKRGANVVVK